MVRFVFSTLLLVMVRISSVDAGTSSSDVIGMAVAGCVSFILLSLVIAFIIMVYYWRDWLDSYMWLRGKVRVSRDYIKKKEEVKRRLISVPPVSKSFGGLTDPGFYETVPEVKEWTLGSKHLVPHRIYEDKDATMDLGEEDDDEIFTIETEVIDDEVIDDDVIDGEAPHYTYVRNDDTHDPTLKDTEADEYPYSSANKLKKTKPVETYAADADDTFPAILQVEMFSPTEEQPETDDEHNSANGVRITRFNEPLVHL